MTTTHLLHLFRTALGSWREDKAPRLGAALAYYTVFSVPPLLILSIGVAGLAFGRDAVARRIISTIGGLVGPRGADAVRDIVQSASAPDHGSSATVIGIVTLVIGAAGVFGQLKDALNTIWEVETRPGLGLWSYLRGNLFSVVVLIGTGFLLLVSLTISAALAALGDYLSRTLPGGQPLWQVVNFTLSLGVLTMMFALMFKFVPDIRIAWRDVILGAAVTAVLFTLGEVVIGVYLGRTTIGSAFGAAGSLLIMLAWIYYSAQIFFFGVEYTKAYATRYGSRIPPAATALPVTEAARQQQGIPHQVEQ